MTTGGEEIPRPLRVTAFGRWLAHPPPGEEVVISGISGSFPESNGMYEFLENLKNKVDMVTENDKRWKRIFFDVPQRTGKVKDVEKFDAAFFNRFYNEADLLDPLARIVCERSLEAVIDAGVNPASLEGKRVGIYTGMSYSETENFYTASSSKRKTKNGILMASRAVLASTLCRAFNTTGPVYLVDSACASSLYALDDAYRQIREGIVDAALVGGVMLDLVPRTSQGFYLLGVLSDDGRSKVFDESADGYARAEAVVSVFLQRASDAKRVYGSLVHVVSNCDGYKDTGITFPSSIMQKELLCQTLAESDVHPKDVAYIEAHGTGTKVGDPVEMESLDKVFGKYHSPDNPQLIGSVKSNIGHTESPSGLCSIAKVILAMETGVIPPNINFTTPKTEITGLVEKRFKVVTEPTKWDCKLALLSSFGFGGANTQSLLRWNPWQKIEHGAAADGIPRLVLASGRSLEATEKLFRHVSSKWPLDLELVSLIHSAFCSTLPGYNHRGYMLADDNGVISKEIKVCPLTRELWFILPGLDSAWPGMGRQLMDIPVFASTIDACHEVTSEFGIDLKRLIVSQDATFDDIVHCLMATVGMQLGLLSILKAVGAKPAGVVGCSVGELVAACVDGCLSLPETLLLAWQLAQDLRELHTDAATTALVEMSSDEISKMLPQGIEISMRNAVDRCTITGSAERMDTFLIHLEDHGVSVKEINWCHLPLHSTNLKKPLRSTNNSLDKVIPKLAPQPKLWRSGSGYAPSCSVRHFWRAFSEPVDLSRVLLDLPVDAVLLEVGADSLFTSQLTNPTYAEFTLVPLMQRGYTRTLEYLLTALGRLYVNDIELDPQALYPPVQKPASRGTPMISPAIQWQHTASWEVLLENKKHEDIFCRNVLFYMWSWEKKFYLGHIIDGRSLFPATGYLFAVIELISKIANFARNEFIVTFENVRFDRATTIQENCILSLFIVIHKLTGDFEIVEGGAAVVRGRVMYQRAGGRSPLSPLQPQPPGTGPEMTTRDVYKELRLRGYNYAGLFRSIHSLASHGLSGTVKWQGNLVAFMDNLLQLKILSHDTRNVYVPTSITKFVVDLREHDMICERLDEDKLLPAYYNPSEDLIRGGGIEIQGLSASPIPRKKILAEPILETHQFIPHSSPGLSTNQMMRVCIHLALENSSSHSKKVKALEIAGPQPLLTKEIISVLGDLPLVQHDLTVIANSDHQDVKSFGAEVKLCSSLKSAGGQNCLIVIVSDLFKDQERFKEVLETVAGGGFIFYRQSSSDTVDASNEKLEVIAEQVFEEEKIIIFRKICQDKDEIEPLVIRVTGDHLEWLSEIQAALAGPKRRVILFAQGESTNGLLGLYNCISVEGCEQKVSCFFIMDERAPAFDINIDFYKDQLKKDLAVNVYRDGAWGSYRHLLLSPPEPRPVRHAYNNTTNTGDLSSLTWLEGPLDVRLSDPSLTVAQIMYAALNFRDVMGATGRLAVDILERSRLNQECVQGLEFSGYTPEGERIMGMIPRGALATLVDYSLTWHWKIPNNWSLADCATLPVAYVTAIYAFKRGQLRGGESVLIHSGSGGVGQAAINYCLFHGCQVFATVGTQEKRDFLLQRFPQLSPDHIGNSRDTSFEQLIARQTGGRGVDIVLNSLAEDKLLASLRCLARGGRFLEIGKFDIANNTMLAASMFSKGQSFHGILLDIYFQSKGEYNDYFMNMLQDAIDEGSVAPLTQNIFPPSEVERAFRFMASGKHTGKVLIKIQEDDNYRNFDRKTPLMMAQPRVYFTHQNSYILIGGLGGFGLELADWMILRGARNLVLTSRKGVSTGYQAYRLGIWKQYGIQICVSTADVGTPSGVQQLLREAASLGPVAGVFNLAVVLKDAVIENQTPESFAESMYPKAVATRLLDEATRRECPGLEHFVVFSSVSCGRGNAGQTNYGYSNSVMERICEDRARQGLPALAVQWGAIGEVGLVADMQDSDRELVIGGTLQQRVTSCLNVLDRFLLQKCPVVASMVVAEKKSSLGAGNDSIVSAIAEILGIRDIKMVNLNSNLSELGMDSMMGVEIKQAIEQHFDVFFTPQDIRNMTFAKLMELEASTKEEGGAAESADNIEITLKMILGEEAVANDPVLPLGTLTAGKVSTCTVFALPGVEGTAAALLPLAANLKATVLGLQFACSKESSIQNIAQALIQQMQPSLSAGEQFNLMAYSFGGVVAMEMVLILEDAGFKGKLILVDSSPYYMKELLSRQLNIEKDDNDTTIQNKILGYFFLSTAEKEYSSIDKFMRSLEEVDSWEDRIRLLLSMSSASTYSLEFQMYRINCIFFHLKALVNYDWPKGRRIKSPVVLIRPTQSGSSKDMEEYSLSQCCEKDVEVYFVEGNHSSVLTNSTSADIINAELIHSGKLSQNIISNQEDCKINPSM